MLNAIHVTRSPKQRAFQRFMRHRPAVIGSVVLFCISMLAILAPLVVSDPVSMDLLQARHGPSAAHWLGTDAIGRDVLARLVFGARVSLSVGILAVGLYLTIGIFFGALAGYLGGWVDFFIMRLSDTILSFPTTLLILVMLVLIGPGLNTIILVLGLVGWPPVARLVRAAFLSLREQEYVQAAGALGAGKARIMFRHMLPGVAGPLVVTATFGVASAILMEAGLSFLGVGVQPPTPSWGAMLSDAQSLSILESMPWLWLSPGVAIASVVLGVNFIGDGLRDVLSPESASS